VGLFKALKTSTFDEKDDGRAEHLKGSAGSNH
jgi:hypothetical protein